MYVKANYQNPSALAELALVRAGPEPRVQWETTLLDYAYRCS